jgi:molybdopterin/thiamine biosynthesis adenylyltransferase
MDVPTTQPALNPWPSQIVIVGCGGVGAFVLPVLLRTVRNHAEPAQSPLVILVDGDTLEARNMERQLFTDADLGKKKSEALLNANIGYYPNLRHSPDFFTGGEDWLRPGDLIFACVDNHPGRARILAAADRAMCDVIVCGNGYTDAEAMMYLTTSMRGTKHDPRIMFPEILTTTTDDPLSVGMGCTGHAQQATPQLAIATFMAAAYAVHLMWYHFQEAHKLEADFRGHIPLRHASNASQLATLKLKDVTS